MRIALILVGMLAITGCTSMLLGNTTSGEAAPAAHEVATSAEDSAISGKIRQQISADAKLGGYAIGIRTRSGNVTLSGTVGSYTMRDRAIQVARETAGVQRVDSRIIVNTRR